MTPDEFNAITQIAQSITTVTVLTLWVYREMKRGDTAMRAIVDDWRELKRERNANEGEFAQFEE